MSMKNAPRTRIFKRPKDPADAEIERLQGLLDEYYALIEYGGDGSIERYVRDLVSKTRVWRPITTEVITRLEATGRYVLVAGDSGYITTPYRVEVCRCDPEYCPRAPWVNHANDCFTDGGEPPTMYMELPDGWVEPEPVSTKVPWLR